MKNRDFKMMAIPHNARPPEYDVTRGLECYGVNSLIGPLPASPKAWMEEFEVWSRSE